MSGWIYYLAAGVLWAGFAAQLPGLWQARRDPLKRALCSVIFLAGGCFALGAPSTVAAINRITGIPNAAAPLTYGAVTAFSAASLTLIIHWRGGDPDQVRRASRKWLIAYALVIVAQVGLFAAGDVPVERRTDFDTYYADTPLTREMIVLYLSAHLAAALTTTVLCWRWTAEVTGWTRSSLYLLVSGWLCTTAYSAAKLTALSARWTGRDWDALSTRFAPLLVAIGSALVAAGYILPLLGPRIDSIVTFIQLRPLSQLLVDPADKRYTVSLSWRSLTDIELQLTKRTTGIRDGIKRLTIHFDDQVRERAHSTAIAGGASTAEAETISAAAMVAVAAQPRPLLTTVRAGHGVLDPDRTDLVRLSRAVRTPIVQAAVREHAQMRTSRQGRQHDGPTRSRSVRRRSDSPS
ncbi:MAB_1171c family putative transporter [Streptomyces xiangluensis]|uniref:MAB_1171c family putative transporter n=1 Tax=Streptomyces xiangluensis TaxID=2665720 RepID=A0ABV8Z1G9_9ACTN